MTDIEWISFYTDKILEGEFEFRPRETWERDRGYIFALNGLTCENKELEYANKYAVLYPLVYYLWNEFKIVWQMWEKPTVEWERFLTERLR